MAPAICFRSAVAVLGGFPVLAGIDLDVDPGQVVLLQGPNGAGKTSLLRACAGLLAVVSGRAEVLGHNLLNDPRSVRRRIGMLGHDTALYDDLTIEDNVRFAVRASRGRDSAVGPALQRLGLDGRLRSVAVRRLSAGQRRRTALAGLVARDPELWLLDEPHAGLDAEHRDLLDSLVRDARQRGATVLLASHERERATGLATRVVTMAGGQVVGAPGGPHDTDGRAPGGPNNRDGRAWGRGPHAPEEPGVGAPGGPSDTDGRAWGRGPHAPEEPGVGAPGGPNDRAIHVA